MLRNLMRRRHRQTELNSFVTYQQRRYEVVSVHTEDRTRWYDCRDVNDPFTVKHLPATAVTV